MGEIDEYDYVEARARRRTGKWKPTQNVLLPGDDELFLESEISRAIRRDNRLNRDEYRVAADAFQCYWRRLKYENWHCSWQDPCPYCEEFLHGRVGWLRI